VVLREVNPKKSTLISILERLDKAKLAGAKVKGMTDSNLHDALQKSSRHPLSLFQPDWVAIVPRLFLFPV